MINLIMAPFRFQIRDRRRNDQGRRSDAIQCPHIGQSVVHNHLLIPGAFTLSSS